MFSDVIRCALERDVAGQRQAINNVVRGVTRVASGLTPRERSFCAFMFVGPPGTGKTHLVRALARTLHGDASRLLAVDCARFAHADPWMAFVAQLAPLYGGYGPNRGAGPLEAPPLAIVLVEYLERGTPEVYRALAAALESGSVTLPHGCRGSLRNCLIFLTTGLCSREILDQPTGIGFNVGAGEPGAEPVVKLHQTCLTEIEKAFGNDLVGRLDGTVVFHKLQPEHLTDVLAIRLRRLDQWLAQRGLRCEMLEPAREFLIEVGRRDMRRGARDLVAAHRKFVEFPLADLLISGRIPPGGLVVIDRKPGEGSLHFTVTRGADAPAAADCREIPVLA